MLYKSILPIIGLLIILFSCSPSGFSGGKGEMVEMRVNHFKKTGIGEGMYLSLQVQENDKIGGEEWSTLGADIDGFEFFPGYVYDLRVRKVQLENPPADGSSIKYILVNVKSQNKVPNNTQFEIELKLHGNNFVTGDAVQFSLLDQYAIDCETLCENMIEGLENEEKLTGIFEHGESSSLILKQLF
ncbi:DUF4377 domain-containing protein [Christiangramia aquimixticola]|uniref:DUF4377 domain-containing protein n=1 Tax=Christiangramia aquimixticola TaxID=1697558 RepID=UPI003AA8E1C8